MVHYTGRALICLFLCFCYSAQKNVTYKGKYGLKSREYKVVYPQKVDETGAFISHSLPHKFKRSTELLHYLIPLGGSDHHLELKPSEILSPGAVLESHSGPILKDIKLSRLSNADCLYTGSVKGHHDSSAAISTCDGLVICSAINAPKNYTSFKKAGYVRTKDGYYLVEPAEVEPSREEDGPQPHLVYQEQGDNKVRRKRTEFFDPGPEVLHVETLLVLDHSFLNYHKDVDVENYVLTVFNMANNLFHDSSINLNINLAIVRLIRLEVEEHELSLQSNKNPTKTMEYFRKWQNKMNPREDSHPNHHDLALLFTRIDICGDDRTCGLMGAARLAGICDPENQAAICQDIGLRMGFTIAHEIGHTLGLQHDSVLAAKNDTTVMSANITSFISEWSNCSRNYLRNFLDSGFGSCLNDPPTDHSFNLVDALPGVMYDADFQCRTLFGPNAALCMTGLECNNIICYIEDKGCVESHMPPAEGTNCGENKWCFHGQCIESGERPKAMDGDWGNWSDWSECTRTCGSGVASQQRYCDNPYPSGGGKFCYGEHRRFRICSTEPCELGEPSFRDLQCAEFNTWMFPEDGKVHQWKSYPVHDENPCALYCVSDVGNVASLRPRVIDGTTCYRGIRDICISGLCQEIPCDLDLQSNAVEDRCGICKGDGTSCNIIRGEKTFKCGKDIGEKQVMEIPRGALNVRIEELTPSESRVEIRDKDGHDVILSGDALGSFTVYDSKAWVGMIRTKQEAISIVGPISRPITLWVDIQQNSTIMYTYGIKAIKKRKPIFSWDFLEWSMCSTECGPGTQESEPKCVEKKAGFVDELYCNNITKPKEQVRTCEIAPCIPMWFVGDWSKCSKCPWGTKMRIVKCFRPIGTGEGELDIVPDTNCAGPKPRTSESCNCREFRSIDDSRKVVVRDAGDGSSTTPIPIPAIRTVIDMRNLNELRLDVHTELESNKYPIGLPHPKTSNASSFQLEQKEALKFLNAVQQDFSNNKTRI